MLASELAEILYCIRCGACLYACPVYQQIGGHAYGSVYSGPVGSVLSPALAGIRAFHDLPHASTLCGACKEVCPVRIDIPRMLLRLRAKGVEAGESPQWVSLGIKVLGWIGTRPRLFGLAGRVAARVAGAAASDGWIRELPLHLAGWTASRDFPAPARESFQERWANAARRRVVIAANRQRMREVIGRAVRTGLFPGGTGPHHTTITASRTAPTTPESTRCRRRRSRARRRSRPPTAGLPRRERFRAALEAIAGVVHEASSIDQAAGIVAGIAERLGTRAILSWTDEAMALPGMTAALQARGLSIVDPEVPQTGDARPPRLAELAALPLGLTGADAGLAETGSVVLATGAGRPRMASLLVPVHVAVLRVDRLVDSISTLLATRGDLVAAGSNLVAITGPSRTADIEHTLSRGVHGPGEVHVILLEA